MSAPAFPTARAEIAERVLAHIRGRTRMGKFACKPYYLSGEQFEQALRDITEQGPAQGYEISWIHGQVLDDPSVTGGWVIDE